uniref:Ribonuclease A-domain domain-containing protein n=1 Tax=Lates calcarifer TaxID=8187 RepID=A0A4W6F232_LATCA
MKIQLACLLLVLLSATELCKALDFYQKHVVDQMDPEKCNEKMNTINDKPKKREIQTFIWNNKKALKEICDNKINEYVLSKKFQLTICELDNNGKYRGRDEEGRVGVICEKKNEPKHLGKKLQFNRIKH